MVNEFKENFDYGSILPTVVFIIGLMSVYFFLTDQFSEGFMAMLSAFIVYIIDNLVVKSDPRPQSQFNDFLDNMGVFTAFALSSITFAAVFFKNEESFLILLVIYFFAVTTLLSLARNWTLEARNTRGWPIAFNGIFLPLIYWIYKFYLQAPGESVFILYFIVVGFLCTTNYNFLNMNENHGFKPRPKDSKYDSDEDLENYINIKEKDNHTGIKKAATFYKTKDVLPLVGKPKAAEEKEENGFTVKKIDDKAPEIAPEDDMILDDEPKKKDDEWEIDENDPQLREFENEGQKVNQPETETKPVAQIPPAKDEEGKTIVEPKEKKKKKGFLSSLFSFGDAKDDPEIVEDPDSRPSKAELKKALKEKKKQEKEEAKKAKEEAKQKKKEEKEAKKKEKEKPEEEKKEE